MDTKLTEPATYTIVFTTEGFLDMLSWPFGGNSQVPDFAIGQAIRGQFNNSGRWSHSGPEWTSVEAACAACAAVEAERWDCGPASAAVCLAEMRKGAGLL